MPGSVQNRTAIFPGSFDPLTHGHLDVVVRAADLFERLVLGVLDNLDKKGLFPTETRVALLDAELASMDNVEVRSFTGLTVDFAVSVGARWIVRGVRSAADVAYELPMVHSNRLCGAEEIETVLIPTRPIPPRGSSR